MKVFISTSSFAKDDNRPLDMLKKAGLEISLNPYGRKLSEDEIRGFLHDVDYLIAGTEPLIHRVLESAKRLKVISRCGTGLDNVDIKAADKLGIKVYNTPYGPTQSVAELTIGLMIDMLRRISKMDRDIRSGVWEKYTGNLLSEKKVGIIGFGKIGQKVAELLMPFGCEIVCYDIRTEDKELKIKIASLDEILRTSDIISIHVSSKEQIIGREEFKKIKKGAWIINVSRGGVIDEAELYKALKEGHLSGAALDVFEREPYTGPLKELDNVILTPHTASATFRARAEMAQIACDNVLDVLLRGKRPRNEVK
ncbi:MAG: phosphoglycerate dehydrogenase [Nitrospirae bacterium]|nr:phosphoglycerate dehydrogenase [Nitrospirota bacterium]